MRIFVKFIHDDYIGFEVTGFWAALGGAVAFELAKNHPERQLETETYGAPVFSFSGSAHRYRHYLDPVAALPALPAGTPIRAVMHGADQEHGLRPGTENVASIVALGEERFGWRA